MKKFLTVLLAGVILTGCTSGNTAATAAPEATAEATTETAAVT